MIHTADVAIDGPIDGTGEKHPDGDYLKLHVKPRGLDYGRDFKISRGAAETLMAELKGVLSG